MSDLPRGWATAKLSQLIGQDGIFSDGDWIESKDQDPNGTIRLLQLADVGDGKFLDKSARFVNDATFERLRCTEVKEDDILVARMPDPLGRACLAPKLPQRCITVVDVAIIRPGQQSVNPKWLTHSLNAPETREGMQVQASGSTRQRIARGKLAEMIFPVPPKPEQKRIADKFDSLLPPVNACRGRLDRVPDILRRFRQSVLAAATSGDLTVDWRDIAGGEKWETVRLPDVAQSRLGKMLDRAKNTGTELPYLRNINVRWFGFDCADIQNIRVSEEEAVNLSVAKGDILVCEGGEPGRCAVWYGEDNRYVFQKALHRIRVGAKVTPQWICYSLKEAADSGRLSDLFTGSTIKHLTGAGLSKFEFLLPTMAEQTEIIRRVETLFAFADKLEARYSAACGKVKKITPAILAKAFRGELVPQDPTDEPASEWIKRITESQQLTSMVTEKPTKQQDSKRMTASPLLSVVETLRMAKAPLSTKNLFEKSNYPTNADAKIIEQFFLDIRQSLDSSQIIRVRQGDEDYFSLPRE